MCRAQIDRRVSVAARANLNTHTVASGENLWAISVARGVTLQELKAANAKALGRAACVDRTWWRAYQRLKRIPQWVGALSRSEDTDVAVAEACKQALGQIRCKPDVAFIFCTPSYDTAKLTSGLASTTAVSYTHLTLPTILLV